MVGATMTVDNVTRYVVFEWFARCNGSVKRARERDENVYGHTTLKSPVLVRSPKLSNVGPG